LLADLDDELSPSLATQLQNLFDTGRVRRVGAKGDTAVDVRILATTSEDAATFLRRPPLGPRFAGHHLVVPPLRARVDDVPGMSNRLLARSAARHARPAREFSPEAVAKLMAYKWPGNVAELSCAVERAALICDRAVVGPSFVAIEGSEPTASDGTERVTAVIDLPGQLDDLERRELYAALDRCGGNKAEVARVLGIQRTTLYYRLKRLGIDV
jgi:two-component system response regulator AtoC/two-component system response regulator HupR/HoxA